MKRCSHEPGQSALREIALEKRTRSCLSEVCKTALPGVASRLCTVSITKEPASSVLEETSAAVGPVWESMTSVVRTLLEIVSLAREREAAAAEMHASLLAASAASPEGL